MLQLAAWSALAVAVIAVIWRQCWISEQSEYTVGTEIGTPPPHGERMIAHDVNILTTQIGEDRYVFVWTDPYRDEALRTLGRFASDPELNLDWEHAAALSVKVNALSQPKARST